MHACVLLQNCIPSHKVVALLSTKQCCPVGQDDKDILQAVELELQQRLARVQALQPDAAMQDGDQAMEAVGASQTLVVCPLPSQASWGHAATMLLQVTSTPLLHMLLLLLELKKFTCLTLHAACLYQQRDSYIVMFLSSGKIVQLCKQQITEAPLYW